MLMTKHLTKPIRAIHFMVLAFLMTLSSSVATQDFDKGLAAYNTGDFATALQQWTPLAEAGGSVAQYNIGRMYNNGYGIPQNYAEAMKWYRLSAGHGYAKAQYNLGLMYDKGDGVPEKNAEAVKWYRKAADSNQILRDFLDFNSAHRTFFFHK